jgi:colicin import membrane protein
MVILLTDHVRQFMVKYGRFCFLKREHKSIFSTLVALTFVVGAGGLGAPTLALAQSTKAPSTPAPAGGGGEQVLDGVLRWFDRANREYQETVVRELSTPTNKGIELGDTKPNGTEAQTKPQLRPQTAPAGVSAAQPSVIQQVQEWLGLSTPKSPTTAQSRTTQGGVPTDTAQSPPKTPDGQGNSQSSADRLALEKRAADDALRRQVEARALETQRVAEEQRLAAEQRKAKDAIEQATKERQAAAEATRQAEDSRNSAAAQDADAKKSAERKAAAAAQDAAAKQDLERKQAEAARKLADDKKAAAGKLESKADDQKTAQAKAPDTKGPDLKGAEKKVPDVKASEVKPPEVKTFESKPVESKPSESKWTPAPIIERKPSSSKTVAERKGERKPTTKSAQASDDGSGRDATKRGVTANNATPRVARDQTAETTERTRKVAIAAQSDSEKSGGRAKSSCRRAGVSVTPPATYVVKDGDTLWAIARRHYDKGHRFSKIVRANDAKISDPDRIFPCQKLAIPS